MAANRHSIHFFSARSILNAGFIFVGLTLFGCVPTNRLDLPPVTVVETGEHIPGKVVWHDLLTSDAAVARDFYGALFGWSFEPRDRSTVILQGNRHIGGIAEVESRSGSIHMARWLAYFSVTDVDQATGFIEQSGGKVHEGPATMKNRGRMAFVSDPQGAQLMLIRSIGGDPQDQVPDIDSWLWDELWSHDAESSVRFYQNLGDYTSVEQLDNYWLLKTNDQWRAGVRTVFEESLEQRWVPVVRVEDPELTAKRAAELGGAVIIDADEGRAALLVDPSGALFMVQSWQGKEAAMERIEQ